jgi:hypothetical protein
MVRHCGRDNADSIRPGFFEKVFMVYVEWGFKLFGQGGSGLSINVADADKVNIA